MPFSAILGERDISENMRGVVVLLLLLLGAVGGQWVSVSVDHDLVSEVMRGQEVSLEAAARRWCDGRGLGPLQSNGLECAVVVAAEVASVVPELAGSQAVTLANVLLASRRHAQAEALLESCLTKNVCDASAARPLLVRALLASNLSQKKRRALDLWRDEGDHELAMAVATAARALGDVEGARSLAEAVVDRRNNTSEEAWVFLAELKAESGESFDFELAKALSSVKASSGETLRQAGLLRLDFAREPQTGASYLKEALALEPSDLGALHGLARAEAELSRQRNKVHFVTFATDTSNCGLQRLLASAQGFGIAITVLPDKDQDTWTNGRKLELLAEHARQLQPDDVLVTVDGYDVVFATGATNTIKRKLDAVLKEGGVLFSADQTFYFVGDDEDCYGRHYPGEHLAPYRFLNSGSLAGTAADVAALAASALADFAPPDWDGTSDQTLLHRIYVEQRHLAKHGRPSPCATGKTDATALPTIVLDTDQVLFGNTGGRAFLRDFTILDGRLHNALTDTFPAVLHAPGQRRFRADFDRLHSLGWDAHVIPCGDNNYTRPAARLP